VHRQLPKYGVLAGTGMRIFLSHSSEDKGFVRRLDRDLKSLKFQTWVDEQQIALGAPISAAIEKGIAISDVLIVVLTARSIKSRWVNSEVEKKLIDQMNKKRVLVIPLLLETCSIPKILEDRLYADFRRAEKYDENLAVLVRNLRQIQHGFTHEEPVLIGRSNSLHQYVADILEDLEEEYITSPVHKRLPIIDTLRKLQRSGKKIRLRRFAPGVHIRTVYDHILSIAHAGDCLLPYLNYHLDASEFVDLARCIAYHELSEVVLGDMPTYTSLSSNSRGYAKLHSVERLRDVLPADRKRIAGDYVWMFLSDKHKRAFQGYREACEDEESRLYKIFKFLDKIDPIIATWRYLHHYRGRLGPSPREFNKKMKDFYENPDVRLFAVRKTFGEDIVDMIEKLQNRTNSWSYYEDRLRIFQTGANFFRIPDQAVRSAIEGAPLFCTSDAEAHGTP
jgi:5'-deoxynucleotidase YfbR-like HD superfamily hydrolase